MKTDRVFGTGETELEERSSNRENMPWDRVTRGVSPLTMRSSPGRILYPDAWPGRDDERWSSRLMASLRNAGRIRLKFRA
jgi:hypothetical protein